MTIFSPKPKNNARTVAANNPALKSKQSLWVLIALWLGIAQVEA